MFNKFFFCFLITPFFTFSQHCSITLTGTINDAETGLPMPYASIYLDDLQRGTTSDSLGFFQLSKLCKGTLSISVSHIGCEPHTLSLLLNRDSSISIVVSHHSETIDGVVVSKKKSISSTQNSSNLDEKTISENADKNLSNLLEGIAGVSTLQNGSGISKPIVHGLYGNRLLILNNGVAQSGQQWGNDHSPEIDPLVANQISVVKGVAALEYQGGSLGSIIIVEPKKINKNEHLNGKANYFFESNGFGHGLNIQLEMNNQFLAWKIIGTLKKNGDKYSSSYFLNNTGSQEANIAVQLEKSFADKWFTDLYFSSFNTELGILRGSHIGNLTDLQSALNQAVPFFTEPTFSYELTAPFQRVNHHLLKLHARYYINSNQYLDFTYAGQLNTRKEFDVRRSGRTETPALSLSQLTNFIEGKYLNFFNNGLKISTGFQFRIIDNTNSPETGILPLIPDYFSYEGGAYFLITKKHQKVFFEVGGRYDFTNQAVAAISISLPHQIVRYNNNFHNFNVSAGISYNPSNAVKLSSNIGYATRNPGINELYSNGLHQGISGIEEGEPLLKSEQSIKATLSIEANIKERFFVEGLLYYQYINNYIYLNPQDEIRLTIRGAFPVFKYQQTPAQLFGLDLATTYKILENLSINLKYSYLRGQDLGNQLPLINMPANNLFAAIRYNINKIGSFENLELEINNKYVFRQNNLLASQDFAPIPNAYNLLGLRVSIEKKIKQTRLKIYARVDNLLNSTYRDYLNRQRYFADGLGINVVLGLSLTF